MRALFPIQKKMADDFLSGATSSGDTDFLSAGSAGGDASANTASIKSNELNASASAGNTTGVSLGVRTKTSVTVCFVDTCAHIEPGGGFQDLREKILDKFCSNQCPRAFINFLELRDDGEKEITAENFGEFYKQSRSLNLTFPVNFQVLYPDFLQVLAREDFNVENDEHRILEQKAIGRLMQLLDSSTLRNKYTSLFCFSPNQTLQVLTMLHELTVTLCCICYVYSFRQGFKHTHTRARAHTHTYTHTHTHTHGHTHCLHD